MAIRLQLRRDTAANWTSVNPILALGEPGVETDTLKVKVGDGVTAWNSLDYSISNDFDDLLNTPTTLAGYGIVDALALANISVTDTGGDGSLSYNNSTGVFTYTGPSASEVRAHFSAGTGITITSGQIATTITQYADSDVDAHLSGGTGVTYTAGAISIGQAVGTGDSVEFAKVTTSTIDSADSSPITVETDVVLLAGLTVGNHILPSSNENIDLGSSTNRFRTLFLAGETIDLAGVTIKKVGNAIELPTGTVIGGKAVAATDQALNTTDNVAFANITATGYIAGPASFVIDPAGVGDNTGTVVIAGNLQVDGTTTTINSTTVSVGDKNIVLGAGATADTQNNGAGITVLRPDSTDASISWDETNDEWDITNAVNIAGNIAVGGTVDGRDIAVDGGKLDGIEAGADVTDATNVTAAGALMDSELANITAVKALNQGVATTDTPNFTGVGIGTNSLTAGYKLDVRGNIISNAASGNVGIVVQTGTNANGAINAVEGTGLNLNTDATNRNITFSSNSVELVRISSTGNLGVGTNDPVSKLQINLIGTANLASASIVKVTDFAATARAGFTHLLNNNDGVYFGTGANDHISSGIGFFRENVGWNTALAFYTNNITSGPNGTGAIQEKMRITSAGTLALSGTGTKIIRRLDVSGSSGIKIQANTNDIVSDTNAGASITLGGGVIGDTFEGNIDITAYGSIVDANRNQIRFFNRSGTDTVAERMRINHLGNVGIGTSTPESLFDVTRSDSGAYTSGNTLVSGQFQRISNTSTAANTAATLLFVTAASGGSGLSTITSVGTAAGSTALTFGTRSSGGNVTEQMRIDSAGNVLIGTSSSPGISTRLVVNSSSFPSTGDILASFNGGTTAPTTERYVLLRQLYTGSGFDSPMLAFRSNANASNQSAFGTIRTTAGGDIVFSNIGATDSAISAASEKARITSAGDVLIGTTVTPNVNPGRLRVAGHINTIHGGVDGNPQISALFTYNSNTNEANAILTSVSSSASTSGFYFDVSNGGGSTGRTRTLQINRSSVTVVGSLSKSSGSFKIDHPLPEKSKTHHLVHSFVEAPQADNIYRGKVTLVSGRAEVNIDESVGMTEGTFIVLNREVQCFTSNETDWDAVRGSVVGNILTIECQNPESTATVSWLVIGERHDKHMFDTDWTDKNGKVIVEPLKVMQ